LIVLSFEHDAKQVPSELNLQELIVPVWSLNWANTFLVYVSQSIAILSSPPEAITLLSGAKVAVFIQFKCPVNSNKNFLSSTL